MMISFFKILLFFVFTYYFALSTIIEEEVAKKAAIQCCPGKAILCCQTAMLYKLPLTSCMEDDMTAEDVVESIQCLRGKIFPQINTSTNSSFQVDERVCCQSFSHNYSNIQCLELCRNAYMTILKSIEIIEKINSCDAEKKEKSCFHSCINFERKHKNRKIFNFFKHC